MTSLVLDLRSNPGGLIREGVAVASLFLEAGDTVATSVGRSTKRSKTYLAEVPGDWDNLRLAVLVNRGTASSAELIAGALQDHDRAVVVGTPVVRQGRAPDHLSDRRGRRPQADDRPLVHPERPDGAAARGPTAPAGRGNRLPSTRPRMFYSSRGRVVPDASGILPDLLVRAMPRSEGERVLANRLGDEMNRFRDVVAGYAAELRAEQVAQPDQVVLTPERRDSLFARMEEAGVHLDRGTYDLAGEFVEEQLGNELTRAFFGSDSLLRRKARTRPPASGGPAGDAGAEEPGRRPQRRHAGAAQRAGTIGGSVTGYAGRLHHDPRSPPHLALHLDLPAPALHQPPHDREAQPRPAGRGREPGLEDAGQQLRREFPFRRRPPRSAPAPPSHPPRARPRSARSPAG